MKAKICQQWAFKMLHKKLNQQIDFEGIHKKQYNIYNMGKLDVLSLWFRFMARAMYLVTGM